MGEALLSSDGGGRLANMPELMMRSEDKTNDGGGDSPTTATTNNVVRWEKFLPKMTLRVMLVEADDCTRQIITALLRKCSYKVVAVSDGLKAWEVLKGRSQNIDLILTEVELPSISGFALLTLIMEHQACKNIPVIMMSAHDSVSTVYKCMLRGAADFLVKPVRKNELKNLWQHVWRRQASTAGGNGNHEESDTQQKVEATAENNATSNRSSGYMACIKRNRECIEKGSDAQSSCTKPDMEADGPAIEETNDLTSTQEKTMAIDVRWENVNAIVDANVAINSTSREAIDLIGSFDSYPKPSYKSSLNYGTNKIDHPSPLLDLSLRRCHPSSSVNQLSDDKHRLKQSDVSAFSRYINRTQPPLTSGSASISNLQKECETTNSDNIITQQAQAESQSQFQSPKERVFPVPVPVKGLRFENPNPNPCLFQPNPYYICNPESADLVMVERKGSDQGHNTTETMEDRGHLSSPTDHSGSSSFCNNGTLSRLNSIGSGSNGHGNLGFDGNSSHRSIQREAALHKFRMKRKDRCFDKKVRYESRKKLAEQRPRVKGQFVRQGQISNSSPMEADTELATTKV
ncbi:two-component response regulator-like APRR5 [Lactuca sativa]|uniref:Two-component response regulator-like APRR5 n=1 Tax=Lactuca sativa TaxID=4236 RepID=A0A9R1X0T9_LACSA|nr:two-component response regulator-like APRR5 [Lactuca sativa]KAJ0194049.1 hypothetical protein LSAT_V11C800390300 [Lactuca sativa]